MRGSQTPNSSTRGELLKFCKHALSAGEDILTSILRKMKAVSGISLLATSAAVAAGQQGNSLPFTFSSIEANIGQQSPLMAQISP